MSTCEKRINGYPFFVKKGGVIVNKNTTDYQRAVARQKHSKRIDNIESRIDNLDEKLDSILALLKGK